MQKLYKTYEQAQRVADKINAQPTKLELLGACIMGAILCGGMIALYFYLNGGF